MRACIQRVTSAKVTVDQQVIGNIGLGMLVLLGVADGDTETDLRTLADKLAGLRIFEDGEGHMNRALEDVGGEMLVVSQFTLLADCRKGRRPSFTGAAAPDMANEFYLQFVENIRQRGIHVETGEFAADMKVELVNDGPVTIWLDSKELCVRK